MNRTLRSFLLATLSLCLLLAACSSRRSEEPDPRIPADLNRTLTNEMSDIDTLKGLDHAFEAYLKQWHIHGATLAIVRGDSLVYAKGYGESETDGTRVQPGTIFRIASVSKLITAIGIMKLQEEGRLSLEDKVFAPEGILGGEPYTAAITDRRCFAITVEQLLRHSSGLTSTLGDPMFSTRLLMTQNHLTTPPDQAQIAGIALRRRLAYNPGEGSEYSNFGYLLLAMIIEKVTGEPYEDWIRTHVLEPAGCLDMHLAFNFYEDRYANETRYFPTPDEKKISCYDGSGRMVERVYGGNDIRTLSGAGAWVASAPELAKLVSRIDGDATLEDILSAESIGRMTLPTDSVTYGIGWNDTKDTGEWTRTGTLSGTTALIKRYPDGETWVFISNTGTWRGARFARNTAELFEKSREEFSPLLPHVDLFYE